MNCIGTYDGTIFYNPANKFCIISVKTADQSVPAEARSNRRYKDHLIRFTAVGYEIPRTDAVELELDGEWAKGKYGVQLQVEQWREIVPRTKNGVEGYHGHHHTQEGAVSHFGQRKPALGLGIRLLKLRSLRGFRFLQFAILQF